MSQGRTNVRRPSASISLAVSSSGSARRPVKATCQPASASASAAALPMPAPAPVTSANLSFGHDPPVPPLIYDEPARRAESLRARPSRGPARCARAPRRAPAPPTTVARPGSRRTRAGPRAAPSPRRAWRSAPASAGGTCFAPSMNMANATQIVVRPNSEQIDEVERRHAHAAGEGKSRRRSDSSAATALIDASGISGWRALQHDEHREDRVMRATRPAREAARAQPAGDHHHDADHRDAGGEHRAPRRPLAGERRKRGPRRRRAASRRSPARRRRWSSSAPRRRWRSRSRRAGRSAAPSASAAARLEQAAPPVDEARRASRTARRSPRGRTARAEIEMRHSAREQAGQAPHQRRDEHEQDAAPVQGRAPCSDSLGSARAPRAAAPTLPGRFKGAHAARQGAWRPDCSRCNAAEAASEVDV